MFCKLVNGFPEWPPKEFIENGTRTVGFTAEFLRAKGYKPLIETPQENPDQLDYYEETDTEIIQHWE